MWLEWLTEIIPGLVIVACLLLWWQAHADMCAMKLRWSKFVSELAGDESWDDARARLKAYAENTDA